MQSNAARLTIGAAAVAAIVILFIVLKGNDDDNSTPATTSATVGQSGSETSGGSGSETSGQSGLGGSGSEAPGQSSVPTIEVKDAQPVGGIQDLEFTEGEDIRFRVDSDVSDEIHFHGYDVGQDVEAGGSVEFDVPATLTGVFEVELEERATQIAEITVNPS